MDNIKAIINDNIIPLEDLSNYKPSNSKIIYEVIRIINGVPIFIEDHLERFNFSMKSTLTEYNHENELILKRILKIIEINKISSGNLKFEIHINTDTQPIFLAYPVPHNYPTLQNYDTGVSMKILYAERENPLVKAEQKELRNKANTLLEDNNIYEILLLNNNKCITEGSKSNFFLIKENSVFTAPLFSILHGITLKKVLIICKRANIPIVESFINEEELKNYEAAFISGTSPKILPVKSVNDINFNTKNTLLRKLMTEYDILIENYIKNWKENSKYKN